MTAPPSPPRDDRHGALGTLLQAGRLFRLIIRRRLPWNNILSLAALLAIVSLFTVVINFIGADEKRLVAPLLERIPHAVYATERCDAFSSEGLDAHMRKAGLSDVASACVRIAPLSLVRYNPRPPRITSVLAVAFKPSLLPVLPGLAEFQNAMPDSDPDSECDLARLPRESGAADLLGDGRTVANCDYTRRVLPMALVSETLAQDAGLSPGHGVTIFPNGLVFADLKRYADDDTADDPRDHIVAGIVPTTLPQPRNVMFVPESALAGTGSARDVVIVRALHAADLGELRRIMVAVDAHVQTLEGVSLSSSIFQNHIWQEERDLRNLLLLLRTATLSMVFAVSVQAANLYVQSERRLFSVSRISGFTDTAIFLTICLVMSLVFLVVTLLGLLAGLAICELVVLFVFPTMTYTVAAGTALQALLGIGAASLLSSLIVMKLRFARDIAKEFQDVSISA